MLEQIEYQYGMLEKDDLPADLPSHLWRQALIPDNVTRAIEKENLRELAGKYGDGSIGSPVEYDYLRLDFSDGSIEITVYNRGITLLLTDDEQVKRIHRVMCLLKEAGAQHS